jgi:hypothetical protein
LKLSLTAAAATLSVAGINSMDVKVPVVVGMGLGAFAAGEAYPQILDAALAGTGDPTATILASVLLANPGRANGGLFARLYPLAALAGINTITRDQAGTGISLTDNSITPIKVDATVEYNPLSDFPAWLNPVSLANTVAATLLPTYLRGVDTNLRQVIEDETGVDIDHPNVDNIPANMYVTLPVSTLPLLEPLALPTVGANLLLSSTGVRLNNPLVTALQPVTESLVNLGYTDVEWNPATSTYDRTLNKGNEVTPFGSLPKNVNVRDLPGNLIKSLQAGVTKAWNDGLITTGGGSSPLAPATQTQSLARAGTPTLAAGSLGNGKLIKELTALVPTKNGLTQLTGNKLQLSTGSSARKTPVKDALTTVRTNLNAAGAEAREAVRHTIGEARAQGDRAAAALKPKPKAKVTAEK